MLLGVSSVYMLCDKPTNQTRRKKQKKRSRTNIEDTLPCSPCRQAYHATDASWLYMPAERERGDAAWVFVVVEMAAATFFLGGGGVLLE